jgi:hypothetical protein
VALGDGSLDVDPHGHSKTEESDADLKPGSGVGGSHCYALWGADTTLPPGPCPAGTGTGRRSRASRIGLAGPSRPGWHRRASGQLRGAVASNATPDPALRAGPPPAGRCGPHVTRRSTAGPTKALQRAYLVLRRRSWSQS